MLIRFVCPAYIHKAVGEHALCLFRSGPETTKGRSKFGQTSDCFSQSKFLELGFFPLVELLV